MAMTELDQLREELKDHTKDDARRFHELMEQIKITNQKLDEILKVYNGLGFMGRFLVQGGLLAAALTAIGAAVYGILHILRTIR